jgi:hypothetical protein
MRVYLMYVLYRLSDWYVFKVFNRVKAVVSLGAILAVFLAASIFNNFCESFKIDIGRLIWTLAILAVFIIIVNSLLNFFLREKLLINPQHGRPEFKKYIIGINLGNGAVFLKKEAEYALVKQKSGQLILPLAIQDVGIIKRDKVTEMKIVERMVAIFYAGSRILEKKIPFSVWVRYSGEHDIEEVAEFIYEKYLATGKVVDYGLYLSEIISDNYDSWMSEAEEIYSQKEESSQALNLLNSYDENNFPDEDKIFNKLVAIFLQVANTRFRPELLSNISGIKIRRITNESQRTFLESDNGDKETIGVPQNN